MLSTIKLLITPHNACDDSGQEVNYDKCYICDSNFVYLFTSIYMAYFL